MEKRVFLIVLDSFGIGAEPDAAAFGDEGTNTLGAIANHPNFNCPNLQKLGLFNIDGVTAGEKTAAPTGSFARLQEQSMGKDTTIGHWEIAGVVSPKPLPTFPEGFPAELIHEFEEKTGHKPRRCIQVCRRHLVDRALRHFRQPHDVFRYHMRQKSDGLILIHLVGISQLADIFPGGLIKLQYGECLAMSGNRFL